MDKNQIRNVLLNYMTPCGLELIPGLIYDRCKFVQICAPEGIVRACSDKLAYQMVGFVLDGSNFDSEKLDLIRDLKTMSGGLIIDHSKQAVLIQDNGIEGIVDEIVDFAERFFTFAIDFSQKGLHDTPEYRASLSPEQRETLDLAWRLNREIDYFSGTPEQARELLTRYQSVLRQAIDMDLGVIRRQAAGYGVYDYLAQREKLLLPGKDVLLLLSGEIKEKTKN